MTEYRARLLKGALAGALATFCMSTVPALSKRFGFVKHLPERQITRQLLKKQGDAHPGERKVRLLTDLMQTTIGTTAGAAFAQLPTNQRPHILKGIGFGLAIWLVGYRGIIPALGLESRKGRYRAGSLWTNLSAHVVYGAALAAALKQLERLEYKRQKRIEPFRRFDSATTF